MMADLRRHGIRMKVFPEHPTLVYRPFTVNKNNYIYLADNGRIHANLDLHDEQGTGLSFYTNREDTIAKTGYDGGAFTHQSERIPAYPSLYA